VTYVADLAPGGAVVDLIAPEAERLGARRGRAGGGAEGLRRAGPAGAGDSRDAARVTVRSTGADPQNPLDDDYRNALALFDLGSDSALVGRRRTRAAW
jgi:hypothetical protein